MASSSNSSINEDSEIQDLEGKAEKMETVCEQEAEIAVSPVTQLSIKLDELFKCIKEGRQKPEEFEARGKELECLFVKNKENLLKDDKIKFWIKLGMLYLVTKSSKVLAIDPFSKVLSLDPTVKEAWNGLAQCYWHGADYDMVQNCLENTLLYERSKKPLRNLSVTFQRLAIKYPGKRIKFIQTALDLAKEAVNKDSKDAISWGILADAYLSSYFNLNRDLKSVQLAISSYEHAITVNTNRETTALYYYSQAFASTYCQFYHEALAYLDKAIREDQGWQPAAKLKCQLIAFINNIQFFHISQGKLKPERIWQFQEELLHLEVGKSLLAQLSGLSTARVEAASVCSLQSGHNANKLIYGKVTWILSQKESFPLTFGCMEASGESFVVTVYNITIGKGCVISDTIYIPQPKYKQIMFEYDDSMYEFPLIQVDNPTQLFVNKVRLTSDWYTPFILDTSERDAVFEPNAPKLFTD